MVKKTIDLSYIKNSFLDVFLLYKNLIHWNFSKLLILLWSILLWFLSTTPFILIFLVYSLFSDVKINMLILWMFNWALLPDFFWNFILILIIVFYFIIFSYSNILLINLNNSYLDWNKLAYKKNKYFKIKKVYNYFKLSFLNFLILLIPVLIFTILITILVLISGGTNEILSLVSSWMFNYFTILSFLFFILGFISIIYLYYRIVFSYFVFSDKSYEVKKPWVFIYIKESFSKTKKIKGFFKFLSIISIFLVLVLPMKYFWAVLENNVKMIRDYSLYNKLTEDQKQSIPLKELDYFEWLDLQFKWYTDSKLDNEYKKNNIFVILFTVFNFLFIFWLFVMIHTSFYKREL